MPKLGPCIPSLRWFPRFCTLASRPWARSFGPKLGEVPDRGLRYFLSLTASLSQGVSWRLLGRAKPCSRRIPFVNCKVRRAKGEQPNGWEQWRQQTLNYNGNGCCVRWTVGGSLNERCRKRGGAASKNSQGKYRPGSVIELWRPGEIGHSKIRRRALCFDVWETNVGKSQLIT